MAVLQASNTRNVIRQPGAVTSPTLARPTLTTVVQTGAIGPVSSPSISDKHYSFTQASASAVWTITHGLNKYPSITIVDSAGDEVEGSVNHISTSTLQVTFSAPFSGRAYLN